MQINTSTSADYTQISHNKWLDSVPKEKVSGEQSKRANDIAAAYGVEISDAGRYMQTVEKQKNNLITSNDATAEDSLEVMQVIPDEDKNVHFVITNATDEEVFSLAHNMLSIEIHLEQTLSDSKHVDAISMQKLAKALNAYGHKQHDAIAQGKDQYLDNILSRLDALGEKSDHPLISEIRSMVNTTKAGKNIDWDNDTFVSTINNLADESGIADIKDYRSNDAGKYFNQNMAVYNYMKEMNRQSQELSLVQTMLGEKDTNSNTLSAGTIKKKSSLADGLAAYHHDMGIVHILDEGSLPNKPQYGEHADGTIIEHANEEPHNSALGYEWGQIMKGYLKEHPELKPYIG